jgi:hypothetical protein
VIKIPSKGIADRVDYVRVYIREVKLLDAFLYLAGNPLMLQGYYNLQEAQQQHMQHVME